MLVDTTLRAVGDMGIARVVISGGVAANSRLRKRMAEVGHRHNLQVFFPALKLCTDNAAMIAFAGAWRLAAGQRSSLGLNASAVLHLETS